MPTIIRTGSCVLFSLLLLSTSQAQTQGPGAVTMTATASGSQVRYVTIGEVHQTRLQVFAPGGGQVFDSDFRLGNLIDWSLQDQQGARVADGSYLFIVTVKDFSGKFTQKYGTTQVDEEQVYVERTDRGDLPSGQATALESSRQGDAISSVDRIGAVGMSIAGSTPGTSAASTARSGLAARDSESSIAPASGTGTTGRVPKWLDGPNGNLDDSVITQSGNNIGISATAPARKLEVAAANGDGIRLSFGPQPPDYYTEFLSTSFAAGDVGVQVNQNVNGTLRTGVMSIRNGNVGIGTISPGAKLDVGGSARIQNLLSFTNTNSVGGVVGQAFLSFQDSAGTEYGWIGDGSGFNNDIQLFATSGNAALRSFAPGTMASMGDATGGNVLNVKSGNVGIGTTNPQSKLDVSGDVNVTGNAIIAGNIAAKYQDVAEWVASREQMQAGTVVILDSSRTNSVVPSRRVYDTLIAGVVSDRPGLILGERADGKVMVATTGRVMVNVDASRYPIRIGDFLVTSDKPGVAMRSRPIRVGGRLIHRPGTIIGKALASMPSGQGKILVLLSLQ